MERSVHDALCVVKRVLESKNVVAGGGAVEVALSIYLENFATTLVSVCLQKDTVMEFRSARLKIIFICRVLANNWLSPNSLVLC